jgi:NOL1/NOP2/fmu family ribosome biogenesis protein
VSGRPAQLYRTFCREHMATIPATDRLALVGSYLYQVAPDLPDLAGLRAIHPGWWLGTLKKGRFEPSHALAMGLTMQDAARSLSLRPDGPDVFAYLRGESLRGEGLDDEGLGSKGEDGWVVIGTGDFPLGWGKRVGRTIKSHYPRGLRWA